MPLNNILKEFDRDFFEDDGCVCKRGFGNEMITEQDIKRFLTHTYNAGRDSREEEIVEMIDSGKRDLPECNYGNGVKYPNVYSIIQRSRAEGNNSALETLKNKILNR